MTDSVNDGFVEPTPTTDCLIAARELPADLAERLNPYVRDKYLELWQLVHSDLGEPGRPPGAGDGR